jgi:hypothetical protein
MAPTGTPKKGASTKAATPKKTQSPIKKTKVRSKVTVTDLGTKSTEAITFLWAALQHELNKNNSGVSLPPPPQKTCSLHFLKFILPCQLG